MMIFLVIVFPFALTMAAHDLPVFTELCSHSTNSPASLPIGGPGAEECAVVTTTSRTLNLQCNSRTSTSTPDISFDSTVWHITINGALSIKLADPVEDYVLVVDDSLLAAQVTVQCGYCPLGLHYYGCNLFHPYELSKPVSIIVIEFANPLHTNATLLHNDSLSVTLTWSKPSVISNTPSFPIMITYTVIVSSTFINSTVPVQFNFATNDTQITLRSCELEEAFVTLPYTWSFIAAVEGITSKVIQSQKNFQFNRFDSCTVGDIRLIDGHYCNEGRVEVCAASGQWGTVCDDGWDELASSVVCNSLGMPGIGIPQFFGPGVGPIHLDDVMCTGMESSIFNCTHRPIGSHDCIHYEDIGVICGLSPQCEDGDIRLAGSSLLNEGRVEVCRSNVWGTVCDDFFSLVDADVACRQLGFPGAATFYGDAFYGPGIGPIVLDDVDCFGNESSLFDCQHSSLHDCIHFEDAGVVCIPQCKLGDVRLVDGETRSEGRVEICLNNGWGAICDPYWTSSDATVICNQLNMQPLVNGAVSEAFGHSVISQPVNLFDIECLGSEDNILECNFIRLLHCQDSTVYAGVVCTEGSTIASQLSTNSILQTAEVTTITASTALPVKTTSLQIFGETLTLIAIGTGILVIFTFLNICIVILTCFAVIRKQKKEERKRLPSDHYQEPLDNHVSLSRSNNYSMHEGSDTASGEAAVGRGGTITISRNTSYYDTVRRNDSFTDESELAAADTLAYGSLSRQHGLQAVVINQDLNTTGNTELGPPRSPSSSEVACNNSTGGDNSSSIYNYPVATVTVTPNHGKHTAVAAVAPPQIMCLDSPQLLEEESAITTASTHHRTTEVTTPPDASLLNTQCISMTHNNAYDVTSLASRRSSPEAATTTHLLTTSGEEMTGSQMSYSSSIASELQTTIRNPVYQSCSTVAGGSDDGDDGDVDGVGAATGRVANNHSTRDKILLTRNVAYGIGSNGITNMSI